MKRINLFIKIYLCFWLTIVITVGVFVYLERLVTTEPVIKHWRNTVERTVSFYAEEAAAIYDRDGGDLLKNYFRRLEKATGIKAFLFNEKIMEVTGETVRKDIREQVSLACEKTEPTYLRVEDSGISIQKVRSPEGRAYSFVALIPHPRPPGFAPGPLPPLPPGGPPPHGFNLNFMIHLIVGLLVSGIICYLLARYLTAPIFKLGHAARQLSDGNLSVRVRPSLGGRQDELSSLANDFDVMAERIETLLTSQRNLLRDVSHELRSPLARLNVALELCRQHSGKPAEKHLDRMALETHRLNDLIGQILTYNKMSAQTAPLQKTKFDLSGLIEEIAADGNYETKNSRAAIRLNEPVVIEGNYDLLRRAIENIIRNALYHTPENSMVEISSTVTITEGKSNVRITVRDHGRGVSPEELSLIFQPFYKTTDVDEHQAGAGLGLAISEAAIRLHNGSIRANNADDNGLIIEILLPVDSSVSCKSYR